MPRPGTQIRIIDGAGPGGPRLATGTAFFIGFTERGPTTAALVTSPRDYESNFGGRSGGRVMYDSVQAYFAEGGAELFVGRMNGPAAVTASGTLGDWDLDGASPGAWANGVTVTADAVDGGVRLLIEDDDVLVEVSPTFAAVADGAAWTTSRYVTLTVASGGTDLPADAATAALAGGADDNTVDEDAVDTALGLFEQGLGPGQLVAPGMADEMVWAKLAAHAERTFRTALLDEPDGADAELIAAATALRTEPGVRFAAWFGPAVTYPSNLGGAMITVPYSAIEAGLIARTDAAGNPNIPAAGINGISRLAAGLTREYDDATRQVLNQEGVNLAKVKYGDIRTYGFRTAAGPQDTNWLWFNNSRLVAAIAHEADAVAENYVFGQIDGRRHQLALFEGDLRGLCLRYFDAGALYGEVPAEAFFIDVGPSVNTTATIANGELHAVIKVKCSPAAEWVTVDIVKVPLDRPIAA